jgi:hypothetical protein
VKALNIVLATAVLASAAAVAQSARYVATLAQPLGAKKELVANNNFWRCNESTCVLTSHPEDGDSVHSCHALKREVGALTAYGNKDKPFDADKLAKCNSD